MNSLRNPQPDEAPSEFDEWLSSQELTPAAAVAEVERTRYLSTSERIKLHTAFENNTAVEFQRRLQYRIADSGGESRHHRP